ncbi:MAG: glucosamine-6-phosphate deaminase, partial [Candidatus Omnitrophica bacterium]|nr:glucosamine-6-phosphate deaminase [Candidatus Omnitrophota bacterium]
MAAILGFTPAAAAQTADAAVSVAGFDWTILLVAGAVAIVIALIAALVKAVRSRLSGATQMTATVKAPESFTVTEADRFAVEAAQQVAAKIKALLETKEAINIIFATGNTMKIFLRELAKIEGIEWARVKAFHLDEYRGLRADHEASFAYFLNENLFSRVAIPQANVNLVADYVKYDPFQYGWIPQVVKQYILGPVYAAVVLPFYLRAYTAALKAEGGADIVMLGIGANGHLAFNEPSMSEGFTSRIRQIKLTQSTIDSNKADYPGIVNTPYAYTMGLADIFEAEHKFLLANGAKKAAIVNTALNGEVTPMVPASGLQVQEHVHVILDNEAANGFGDTIKEGADVITTGATATVKRNGILFKTLASVAVISGLALVTQAYLFGALTAVVGMAVANIVIFGIFMAATDLVGQWIAGHGIIKKQVAYAFPLGIGMGILSWIFFNVIAPET